jgi:hypothetical protein
MLLLFILTSLATGAAGLCLVWRLRSANEAVRRLFSNAAADPLTQAVCRALDVAVDSDLLATAGPAHLAEVEVRFREHCTPYRTVLELVGQMEPLIRATSYTDLHKLIEMLYQLQMTFALPPAKIEAALNLLMDRLTQATTSSGQVGRIEMVAPGTLLDPSRMLYVTAGTHVQQPLGVIVYDKGGKVISKARVLCS